MEACHNLRDFLARLDGTGELHTVAVPVDPVLEIAAITDLDAADIAEALSKALGQSVDKHQIELEEHIRHVGPHTARVHVAPHISATLKLTVEPER